MSLLLSLILASNGIATAAEVHFAPGRVAASGLTGPSDLVLADLDGDGRPDLLTLSTDGGRIVWYRNTGGAIPFGPQRIISDVALSPRSIAAADIDRDGDLDVVSASAGDSIIGWHENLGGGSFGDPAANRRVIASTAAGPAALFVADIDRDGYPDVVSGSSFAAQVFWFRNDGAPRSSPEWIRGDLLDAAGNVSDVAVADLDRDGDPDVIAGLDAARSIVWFENADGAGSFATPVIVQNTDGVSSLFVADPDGDGDPDVLAASCDDGTLTWYLNDGGPADWIARVIPSADPCPESAVAADIDQDGDPDVLAAASGGSIAWYPNEDGAGSFGAARRFPGSAAGALVARAADLDRDGDPDVVASSGTAAAIELFENRTIHRNAVFEGRGAVLSDFRFSSTAAADLDSDGDPDPIGASGADRTIQWAPNFGGGEFGFLNDVTTGSDGTETILAADLDRDGTIDLIGAGPGAPSSLVWYPNPDGAGTFPVDMVVSSAIEFGSIAAGDVDGDADLDLIGSGTLSSQGRFLVFENTDGAGAFMQLIATTLVDVEDVTSVAAADVDRDGDLDLIAGSSVCGECSGGKVDWFENTDGTGAFSRRVVVDTDRVVAVAAGDLDRDGDPDVLFATANAVAWIPNADGRGGFGNPRTIAAGVHGAGAIALADADRDGDLDVLVASSDDGLLSWHANLDGAGTFGPRQMIAPVAGVRSPFPADLDRDGDLDLLAASPAAFEVVRFENRGGQYTFTTTAVVPAPPAAGERTPLLAIAVALHGRPGDPAGELANLALLFEETAGDSLSNAEANALIERLLVYRDDGSGAFEGDRDVLVDGVETLELEGGLLNIPLTDGDLNVRVAAPARFFVVADLSPDAATLSPNRFRVTHLAAAGSAVEDATADIVLAGAPAIDVAATVVSPLTPIRVDAFFDVVDPEDGVTTLREAILLANAAAGEDRILLGRGTYSLNGASGLDLTDTSGPTTIVGEGADATIIGAIAPCDPIEGIGLCDRVFRVRPGVTVEITGLTITGGLARNGNGGGVLNEGNLTIRRSTLRGNRAQGDSGGRRGGGFGGGIHNTGTLVLEGTTLSGNEAFGGDGQLGSTTGAGGGGGGGAGLGGGLFNDGGAVTVTGSTFSGNLAMGGRGANGQPNRGVFNGFGGNGGGAGGAGGGPGVTGGAGDFGGGGGGGGGNATGDGGGGPGGFGGGGGGAGGRTLGGSGADGGAGGFGGGKGTRGNFSASGGGGGGAGIGGAIFNMTGPIVMRDTTITENVATGLGGGADGFFSTRGGPGSGIAGGVFNNDGTIDVKNSVFAGNKVMSVGTGPALDPDAAGQFTSGGFNLIGDAGGATGFAPSDRVGGAEATIDPLLTRLQNNGGPTSTHAPRSGSPAIDAGRCTPGSGFDQRGARRPTDLPGATNAEGGDGCDIGAVEATLAETVAQIQVPVRWCGVAGTPSIPLAAAPATVNDVLRRRHQDASTHVLIPGANIRFRSGATANIPDFPLLDDPDPTIGGPGDVFIDPDARNFDEFQTLIARCRTAWEERDSSVVGITAVQINRFVGADGSPLPILGLGGRAQPLDPSQQAVAGRVMVVDRVHRLEANPPDLVDRLLAHELGHALSLRHGDGEDGDGDGILDNDDERATGQSRFDGPNLMQYRNGAELSILQAGQARLHSATTIPDISLSLISSQATDDAPIELRVSEILDFGLSEILDFRLSEILDFGVSEILDFGVSEILDFDFADIVDFGMELEDASPQGETTLFTSVGGLPWPSPIRLDTTYYFYLDLDRSDATGGVPGDFGFPGAGVAVQTGVDLIARFETTSAGEALTVFRFVDDPPGYVEVPNPAVEPTRVDRITIGLFQDIGGESPDQEDQALGANVRARVRNDVLQAAGWQIGTPVNMEALSVVRCSGTLPAGIGIDCQCTDCADCPDYPGCAEAGAPETVGQDVLVQCAQAELDFTPPIFPGCQVVPATAAPGQTVTLEASDFPGASGSELRVLAGDLVLATGAIDASGAASVPVVLPGDLSSGELVLTASLAGGAAEASCAVLIVSAESLCAVDDLPPEIEDVPAPIQAEQTALAGTPVSVPLPAVMDICDPAATVTSDAPSIFPLGATLVTFTATDASGNQATATTTVTIVDTTRPALVNVPVPIEVEQEGPAGTALVVPLPDAADTCDADPLVTSDAPDVFPPGATIVTFAATDDSGNAAAATTTVTVVDTTPPALTVAADPIFLWPPNHRLVPIDLTIAATDNSGLVTLAIESITSSEPDDAPGGGDGATTGDIAVLGTDPLDAGFALALRAERAGGGPGRVYTIRLRATDPSGNTSVASAFVQVPHDRGGIIEPLTLTLQPLGETLAVQWNPIAEARHYNLIRGRRGEISDTPSAVHLGSVTCLAPGVAGTAWTGDGGHPAPGEAFFYLVEYDDGRRSGFGTVSVPRPREPGAGGCP